MSSPSPQPHVSRFKYLIDLTELREKLLDDDLKARFRCLYYHKWTRYCTNDCEFYGEAHSGVFRDAVDVLAQDVSKVGKEASTTVLRTFFCGDHDLNKKAAKYREYKDHFEALWDCASSEMKSDVWDAIRMNGRDIDKQPSTPTTSPSPSPHRRPRAQKMNSAPDKALSTNLKPPRDTVSLPPNLDVDTPSRPQTAQAKLGHSAEPSAYDVPVAPFTPTLRSESIPPETNICPSTSSPYLPQSRQILKPNLKKPQAKQPTEISAQIPNSFRCDAPFSEDMWRDVFTQKENPFSVLQQGERAKALTPHDVGSVENSEQTSVPTPQDERHSKESVTQTTINNPKPQAYQSTYVLRGKLPVAPEHEGNTTALESTSSPPDDPIKCETLLAEHSKATASPAQKTTPEPCAYDTLQQAAIATKIRSLLLKDVEKPTGAIYVLIAPKFFSTFPPALSRNEQWVKIGISSDITKRMSDIKRACGITDLQSVHISDSGTMRMQLLQRIEQVCHAELNNFRRRMDCKNGGAANGKCDAVHTEWFAIDVAVAVRTVEMWRRFLDRTPYGDLGMLTDFWKGKLAGKNYPAIEVGEGNRGPELAHERNHELAHGRFEKWLTESE